jgi:hypothetical protein
VFKETIPARISRDRFGLDSARSASAPNYSKEIGFIPRKPVLMSGAIEFAGSTFNCLIRDISISGAALDVTNPHDIPERFNLVFKADGAHIPCHVIWRQWELRHALARQTHLSLI